MIRSRRVGPATFQRLVSELGSVVSALDALPEIAGQAGVKNYSTYHYASAERELDAGLHLGFAPIFLGSDSYPPLLAQTSDAPPFIWANGNVGLGAKPCLALVGARNASSLGRRMASAIARDLGEAGFVTVSGLARGIDAAVHSNSLSAGTIAVQAGGLDIVYPKENADLTKEIGEQGLCISEQPVGLIPQARHFPQRNRIISGISQAVIVIEGAARSGSLITARYAADIGREVMAVPGSPMDGRASGCNMLIRDGAVLVRSAQDIIDALDQPLQSKLPLQVQTPTTKLESSKISERILSLLGPQGVALDDLVRDIGLPTQTVTEQLTTMELDGKIERQPGGFLSLAS